MTRWGRSALVALMALLVAAVGSTALAQTTQLGAISGLVTDAEERPIADAVVSIAQLDGSYPKTAITDARGRFSSPFLPPGAYSVRVTADGFNPNALERVRVNAGRTAEVVVQLAEALREEVTVTAAAPIIDTTSTEAPTVLESESIEALPTTRDVNSLINFTPGARVGSVWGAASGQANTYRLDGVTVDQPGFGGSFLLPNIDWVEEFQVRGLGAGAEYGNFQGGMINVVTKSGSNTFKADFRANYESESLNSTNVNLGELGEEQDLRWEVNASVSGPIIEDKLYYFFSAQQVTSDVRVLDIESADLSFLDTKEERVEQKLFGKLTWQANDSNLFNFVLGYDNVEVDNLGIGSFTNPEATAERESPAYFYSLTWNWTLDDDMFLETKITGYNGENNELPKNGRLPTVQELGGNRELFRNAIYTREREPESLSFASTLNAFVYTGEVRHHLKIGGEYTTSSWLERRTRQANLTWRPRIINDPVGFGDPEFDPNDPTTWISLISSDWGGNIRLDAEIVNAALFVQDYMQLTPRLSLAPGIRWNLWEGEVTPGFSSGGAFTAIEDDAFDPRFGVIYDFGGDGRWVAKAHWGRYHQNLFAAMFDRVQGADAFTNLEFWDWIGAGLPDVNRNYTAAERDNDPDNWAFFDDDPLGEENGPVQDYEQPYVDQIVLSLEHAINDRLKIGATYVNRVNENIIALVDQNLDSNYTLYENVSVFDFSTGNPILGPDGNALVLDKIFISNGDIIDIGSAPGLSPAEIAALTFDQDFVLTNAPGAERELDQFHLTADYQASAFSLSGSIVYSDLSGNFNSVSGYAGTVTGAGGFVDINEQINWNGDLPDSSEIEVKLRSIVYLPWDFRLGAFVRYFSGDRYTPTYTIEDQLHDFVTAEGDLINFELFSGVGGQDIFIEQRGNREYESELTIDLSLDKRFLFGDLELVVGVDVFNLLNSDAVRLVETEVTNDFVGSPDVTPFGTPLLRQPPRAIRLKTSLSW